MSVERLFLILAFFWIAGCGHTPPLKVGDTFPDIRLETLEHGRFYMNQQHGKVVMLVFWSTFCTHCKEELNALKKFPGRYSSGQVVLAAVCTDPENETLVRQIRSSLDLPFPVLLDRQAALFTRLGLNALPTTVLIDQQGRCALLRTGFNQLVHRQLADKVHLLLDGNRA